MRSHDLGEKGVALALTLWLVVLLGGIAAAVVTSTRSTSNMVLNARARAVAKYAAESGIVAGTAVLNHSVSARSLRGQSASPFAAAMRELAELKDVPLGNARFSVAVTNLSGRLDLNQADPEALVGLLSQFTSVSAARALVEVLKDWRDPDGMVRPQGAEEQTYARAGSPVVPRNGPLSRIEEFYSLLGMTESLALAVEPYVTVNGGGTIDVNAAPEAVLAAMPGIGRSGARTLLGRRRSGTPFTSAAEVQALLGGAAQHSLSRMVVVPSRLLLTSQGRLAGHPLTHEIQASYAVIGSSLVLRSWRERDL
jgi:general secretion pathway protein K